MRSVSQTLRPVTAQRLFFNTRYVRLQQQQWQPSRHYFYGRPLSVSGRPCYILPMFFFNFFYGRLILRPWLTEVRESFTRGGP